MIDEEENKEKLIYAAEVIEWAVECAIQVNTKGWVDYLVSCERIDVRTVRPSPQFSVTTDFLESLALKLRKRASKCDDQTGDVRSGEVGSKNV